MCSIIKWALCQLALCSPSEKYVKHFWMPLKHIAVTSVSPNGFNLTPHSICFSTAGGVIFPRRSVNLPWLWTRIFILSRSADGVQLSKTTRKNPLTISSFWTNCAWHEVRSNLCMFPVRAAGSSTQPANNKKITGLLYQSHCGLYSVRPLCRSSI